VTKFHISNSVSKSVIFSALLGSLALLAGCSGSSGAGSDPLPDPAPDTTPDSFSFAEHSGVALDSPIESEAVTISGIDTPADISIEGGQYAIDGGDFNEADDEISNGQQVVVQVQSATTPGALTEATLTVGGVEATFSVTTQNDPTGYYTGTAEITEEDNETSRLLGDKEGETVHGLLTDKRFLIFSTYKPTSGTARTLTYEATNIELTGTDYTADLTIYDNGEVLRELSVEGTVTEGSSLTMSMDGEGAGNGTIEMTYAESNSEVAALERLETSGEKTAPWVGGLNDSARNFSFDFDGSGGLSEVDGADSNSDVFNDCKINGTASVLEGTALYSVEAELTECNDTDVGDEANGVYTGLITLRDVDGADDELVLIFSDDTLAGAGVFEEYES
jgi:hypothetical protein